MKKTVLKKYMSIILLAALAAQSMPVFANDDHPAAIEYIRGVNGEASKVRVTSSEDIDSACLVEADYTNDRLCDMNIRPANGLSPENSLEFTDISGTSDKKFMLWQDMDGIMPLTADVFCRADSDTTEDYDTNKAGGAKVTVDAELNGASPSIEKTDAANINDANCICAVDVSLKDGAKLNGVAEIRIKYDRTKNYNASNLIAGYFNEDTCLWEVPCYYIDDVADEAVIITDHFSKYGLFEVEGSGKPTAFAKPLEPSQISQQMFFTADTILAIFNHDNPPPQDEAAAMVLEALDGSFNGKLTATGNNINTILTRGGKISTGVLGKISTQYTVIGVVGGCISTANNAYKHGVFSTQTLEAIGRTGIAAGVSAASSGVQIAMLIYGLGEMSYNHVKAKELAKDHEELLSLHRFYIQHFAGKRSAADWYNYLEPYYSKYCRDMNDKNIVDNYAEFDKSVKKLVQTYAYSFAVDYRSGELYGKILNIPIYTEKRGEMADDICANYEAEIWDTLRPVLMQFSQKAYLDAEKGLAKECEELRELLNGEITLNFYTAPGSAKADIAPNCYVRFYDAENKDLWRRDFDKNGRASITFTLLAYNQLECPYYITVFDKKTDKAVGKIELPDNMEPGKSYDVPYDTDYTYFDINIHEVKESPEYPYVYAGMRGRLAPVIESMYADDFAFTLDENGRATLEMTYAKYFDNGAPKRIEILDESGKVVYRTPFDIAMSDVPLDGSMYSVDIKCTNDKAIDTYKYRKTDVVYFETFDSPPTAAAAGEIDGSGKCTLMFTRYGYEFYNKDYVLYIYDEKGEKPELIFDLSESYGEDKAAETVELKLDDTDDPDKEELKLDRECVFITPNTEETVNAASGAIATAEPADTSLIEADTDGVIKAKDKTGETYVTFGDKYGNEIKVLVIITDNIYEYVNPICRGCQTYLRMSVMGRETENHFEPWSREDALLPYKRVSFATSRDVPGSGIGAITIKGEDGSELYFRLIPGMESDRLYRSDYGATNVKTTEWIQNYDFNHFTYVEGENITSDIYRERWYYYERTDLKDYPKAE